MLALRQRRDKSKTIRLPGRPDQSRDGFRLLMRAPYKIKWCTEAEVGL